MTPQSRFVSWRYCQFIDYRVVSINSVPSSGCPKSALDTELSRCPKVIHKSHQRRLRATPGLDTFPKHRGFFILFFF